MVLIFEPGPAASNCSDEHRPSFNLLPASHMADPGCSGAKVPTTGMISSNVPVVDKRSFADAVKNGHGIAGKCKSFNAFKSPLPLSFENIHAGSLNKEDSVGVKNLIELNGRPCVYLSNAELNSLAKPLDLSLIGKFSQGRPKWITLNRYFMDLRLHAVYKLASLDSRHFVIHLNNFEDYTKIFSKPVSTIKGHVVKYFKWTLDFDVNNEPPITPTWISMPLLKMSMFTQNMLFNIANAYGKPLLLDPTTALGNNPGVARVLVEMDVLANHPDDVWVGNEVSGFAQVVEIENKPKYCSHCRKYGHKIHECFKKHPELDPSQKQKKTEWKVKNKTPPPSPRKEDVPGNDAHAPCIPAAHVDPLQGVQKETLAEAFWDRYKEQMRIDDDHNKEKMQATELDQDDIPPASHDLVDEARHDFEIFKNIAEDVILQVTEKIYEECYNKAFNEEVEDQVEKEHAVIHLISDEQRNLIALHEESAILGEVQHPSDNHMMNSGSDAIIIPNINDESWMEGSDPCSVMHVNRVGSSLITKDLTDLNIFDMDCMGFKTDRADSDVEDSRDEADEVPPHSKNKRRSWGNDESSEWCPIKHKHKRGRKKKGETCIVSSPRKTRGRTRVLEMRRLVTDEDSS